MVAAGHPVPGGLPRHAARFLDYLIVERGLSNHSLAAYQRDLKLYQLYLSGRGIS
jgi:site-specific recombinase XerD